MTGRRAAWGALLLLLAPLLAGGDEPEPERHTFRIALGDQVNLRELLNQLRPTMGGHYTFPPTLGDKVVHFTGGLEIPYRDGHLPEDLRAFYSTLLQINGYSMVDRGTITEIVEGQHVLRRPIHFYAQEEIDRIPATDSLVAVMYTFRNFDANLLGARLQPLLIEGAEQVVTVPNSPAIILVAYATKLRELVRILHVVDAASPGMELRMFPLTHAAADEILPVLEKLLQARLAIGAQQPVGPQAPGRREADAPVLVADPRSNRAVYAMAAPAALDTIAELVGMLDREVQIPGSRVRFYPLQYRSAETRSSGGGEGEVAEEERGLREILLDMYEERRLAEEERTASATGAAGDATGGVPNETTGGRLVPRFVADSATNHLIVIYPSERYIPEVEDAIARLDRRTPQVFIEAVILELGRDATRELGIEIASLEQEPNRSGGSPRFGGGTNFGLSQPAGEDDVTGRQPIFSTGSLTAFLFKDKFEHIPILMRLLQTDSDSQVLAVPRIMTDANRRGVFRIVQNEPYQVSSQGTATTVTSTEFQEAETKLEVTPSVGRETVDTGRTDAEGRPIREERYFVRMRVLQTIETFTTAFAGGATPATNRREAETAQITIPDGATVIFGGFTNKTHRAVQGRVPFFGSIPLLGPLFRSRRNTDVYTTIFVFLTPHVITDSGELAHLEDRLRTHEELAALRARVEPLVPPRPGDPRAPAPPSRDTRDGYVWPD